MAVSEAKSRPHGIDKAIWAAIDAKFDPTRAVNCMQWIHEVTGEEIPEQTGNVSEWFADALKNGYYMAKLVLTLDPEVKDRIKKRRWKAKKVRMPFQAMEQIDLFGRAVMELGVRDTDVCTSQDVWNKENPNQVITTLYALNAVVSQRGWSGPLISDSYKKSTENVREFDAATLAKGRNEVPVWNRGGIQHEGDNRLDSCGIMKNAGNEKWKSSNTLSKWEQGSIEHKQGNSLDKILRTAGNEGYQADQSTVPIWNRGSKKNEGQQRLDKIVRTQGNEDWVASNEIPQMSKTKKTDTSSGFDSYGIVRNN